MALVLAAMVVMVAYGAGAPQLAVAEFSPAARSQVEPPPTTGVGGPVTGAGQGLRLTTTSTMAASATTSAVGTGSAAPTTRQARARSCVGVPPRQIDDPLSPPCLPTIFEGDNGGATSRGVTATEIRVAVPASSSFASTGPNPSRDAVSALFEFVNRHFELYGRRLVPVFVSGTANDAVTSRAQGAAIAAEDVFGALTGMSEATSRSPQAGLVQELARAGVVTVVRAAATWWTDRTLYDPFHPYIWSLFPSSEQVQASLGTAACAVAGRPANLTTDADLVGQTRKFGILAAGVEAVPATSVLGDALRVCTGQEPVRSELASKRDGAAARRPALTRLADRGVTSVICVCEGLEAQTLIGEAHRAGFDPEWLFTPTTSQDDEVDFRGLQQSGVAGEMVQLYAGRRWAPLVGRPWFSAVMETNPNLLASIQSGLTSTFLIGDYLYDSVLLLAAGIQGAGPTLTPESFAAALMSMQFPNPGAGQPPSWQPSVGFGPGDHGFFDDYAVRWYSETAETVQWHTAWAATGSWCYVGAGSRFRSGNFPADLDQRIANPSEPCR